MQQRQRILADVSSSFLRKVLNEAKAGDLGRYLFSMGRKSVKGSGEVKVKKKAVCREPEKCAITPSRGFGKERKTKN